MNIALVHERLTAFTGSEAVVDEFTQIWPQSTVHVPIVDQDLVPSSWNVRTTWLNRLYTHGGYAHLLPLLPGTFRHLHIRDAELILTSHHAFANQVAFANDVPIVSYVHSPARWMWDASMREGEPGGAVGEAFLKAFSARQRRWDLRASAKIRLIISNSNAVAGRVRRWWKRDSVVIHPPVDVDFYTPEDAGAKDEFVLLAGRLVPYKRPELAVLAAERCQIPLVVVGEGRAMDACKRVAGPNTTFVGRVDRVELRNYYRRARALLMPGEEDFGIVPVEAQACGTPVVALGSGGALDYVSPGRTGLLFEDGPDNRRVESFQNAIQRALAIDWDPAVIRQSAEAFSPAEFRRQISAAVDGVNR